MTYLSAIEAAGLGAIVAVLHVAPAPADVNNQPTAGWISAGLDFKKRSKKMASMDMIEYLPVLGRNLYLSF